MNPAEAQGTSFEFGNADSKAQSILDDYFKDEENNPAEQADANQPAPEMEAEQAQESDAEQAAPTDKGEGEEQEERQQYTVAELAEHLGVDASVLYGADVMMSDGTRVNYAQMKDEWQAAKQQEQELEQRQAQLQAYQENLQQQQSMLQAQANLGQMLAPDQEEQDLIREWVSLDNAERDQNYWSQQKDQGAAARALQQIGVKKRELEGKITGKQQGRQQQAVQMRDQYLQAARADIGQRIPEWKDGNTLQQDWSDIQQLSAKFGLTQQEIDSMWQAPPVMHMAHTFLRLLRQYKNADPKAKKVNPIKGLKPAGRKAAGSSNKPNEALVRAAKSGNRKAQDALGSQILDQFLR